MAAFAVTRKSSDADDIDEAEDRVIADLSKKDKRVIFRTRPSNGYLQLTYYWFGINKCAAVHKVTIVPRGRVMAI